MDLERVYRSAAKWLVASEKGLSPQDRLIFENWLLRSPLHRVAFIRLQALSGNLNRMSALRPVKGNLDPDLLLHLRKRPSDSASGRPRAPVAGVGAIAVGGTGPPAHRGWNARSILASFVVGTVLLLAPPYVRYSEKPSNRYTAPAGVSHKMTLSDGTIVELSGDSEIRVNQSAGRNEIVLVRGKAIFKVGEKPSIFVVRAGETVLRTTGAKFSIHMNDARKDLDVQVVAGRVWLAAPNVSIFDPVTITLVAGAHVQVHREYVSWLEYLDRSSLSRRLKWTGGLLSFAGETLAEVAQEFNRYNSRQLIIADDTVAKIPIGGAFQASDLDSFVTSLCTVAGISAVETKGANPVIVVRSTRDSEHDLCRLDRGVRNP
jgi:transmembrane sensor